MILILEYINFGYIFWLIVDFCLRLFIFFVYFNIYDIFFEILNSELRRFYMTLVDLVGLSNDSLIKEFGRINF